jgi:hypothetical protein
MLALAVSPPPGFNNSGLSYLVVWVNSSASLAAWRVQVDSGWIERSFGKALMTMESAMQNPPANPARVFVGMC